MERFNIFLEFKVKADLHYAAPWHFLSNTEEQGHCFLIHLNPWHFCVTLSNIHALLFPLYPMKQLSSVQFIRSVVSDLLRPHESQHARPPCPSPTPRLHSDSHPSSQWCYPAISSSVIPFSSCPQSLPAFSNESTLRKRWPKYWSFSFSIIPSKEHPGLISFRMDWLDLLAVQGTFKSLLQHHSSKASIQAAQGRPYLILLCW